jgi:hypothetical protein
VAKNDSHWIVRRIAYEKLGDWQSSLALTAINGSNRDICKADVAKLTDQNLLADVAKNANYYDVREAAVEKLSDQSVLADVAKNACSSGVRNAAVEKLTDPEALKNVAQKYLSDICDIKGSCDYNVWQKVKALISIAKKSPQLLKENWIQINQKINKLHEDIHKDSIHNDSGNSDCSNTHEDIKTSETAASRGLVFPPYPFDD